MSSEFTVSGFKPRRKRGVMPRADRGKRHRYPMYRMPRYTYNGVRHSHHKHPKVTAGQARLTAYL